MAKINRKLVISSIQTYHVNLTPSNIFDHFLYAVCHDTCTQLHACMADTIMIVLMTTHSLVPMHWRHLWFQCMETSLVPVHGDISGSSAWRQDGSSAWRHLWFQCMETSLVPVHGDISGSSAWRHLWFQCMETSLVPVHGDISGSSAHAYILVPRFAHPCMCACICSRKRALFHCKWANSIGYNI